MVTLIVRPGLEKQGYRLKCRWKTDPHPTVRRFDREKVRIAEQFVLDMHKQGWEHDNRFPFKVKGPFPMVEPVTIHPRRTPTAKEMLPYVANGARFLDTGDGAAKPALTLGLSEYWEYEIAGVFVRTQILTEQPDPGEE